jgi:hypothetical protein
MSSPEFRCRHIITYSRQLRISVLVAEYFDLGTFIGCIKTELMIWRIGRGRATTDQQDRNDRAQHDALIEKSAHRLPPQA